jgi:predicted acyltransferase (DUF342 family)
MPRFLLIAFIVSALSLGGPLAPAAQAATTCPPSPTPGTTILGNLVVPATGELFSPCILDNVTVTGNVTVGENRSLILENGSTIKGNLTATNPLNVRAEDSTVNGKITITGAGTATLFESTVFLANLTVGGEVSLTNNDVGSGQLRDSRVGGNVTVNNNAVFGVINNTINGKLSCSGNGTVLLDGNTAKGGKFGQCADN